MTRLEEIRKLEGRYAEYTRLGKRKAAALVYARLCSLRTRQLKSELRASRSSLRDSAAGSGASPHVAPGLYSDDMENCTEVYGAPI